ncbi:MAG TPA: MspA family porin [Mycobacterium sp.]|nr:MspA family porin [Mycobacterium sp.]
MRTIVRRIAVAVSPLLVCSGVAAADPMTIADVSRSADTDDGWHLSASLTQMTVDSVANMADTPLTKEAFVSGKAVANIDGDGTSAVNSGNLLLGEQLGCQLDVSQGGNVGLSGDVGVGGFDTSSSNLLSALGPNADISPNGSINLLPGNINTLGLGKLALKGRNGEVTVHDAHVKIDGCAGHVVMRFFAFAEITTDNGNDSVNVYGDIVTL